MKSLILLMVILTGQSFAEVKITIFERNSSDSQDRGTTVCGQLTPVPTTVTPVFVTTDKDSFYESQYTTHANLEGKFCLLVSTYLGNVEAAAGSEKAARFIVK